jgi:hypothetical protein
VKRAERLLTRAHATGDPRFAERLRAVFAHWEHGDTFRLRTDVLRELGLLAEPAAEEREEDLY